MSVRKTNLQLPIPDPQRSGLLGNWELRSWELTIAGLLVLLSSVTAYAQGPSGEAIYKRRCAACHERPADGRTPGRDTLQSMPSSRILRTLDFGAMMTIAYQLKRDEREAVAPFLGKPGGDPTPHPEAFCRDRSVALDTSAAPIWNGWSPSPDNSRFAPAALAKLTTEQVSKLKLKWAFGFDGDISAFAQPTVIGNQVFIGSAGGVVHALRADTGCLQWTFQAAGSIRSAIVAAPDATAGTCCSSAISPGGSTRSMPRTGQRDLAQATRGT